MAWGVLFLRSLLRHGAGFAAAALVATSAASAAEVSSMKIERVTSPGGIEAWLVESHANPLIAMRFAFRGGAPRTLKPRRASPISSPP
jgi:zinc protease